ncbi:MAG: hypothetical protein ACE5DI_05500, partial [Candidatus Micrarchaeia archaeon]
MSFNEIVKKTLPFFAEKERRQDAVLQLNREIVRDSARAIRAIHTGELGECEEVVTALKEKLSKMKGIDEG